MKTVPNTDTFTLRDVVAVTGGTSLRQAFARSIDACFDPAYGYVPGDPRGLKMSMFRNYHMLEVGDLWGGGVIAHIDFNTHGANIFGATGITPTFQSVLICALADSARGIPWAKTPSGAIYMGYKTDTSSSVFAHYAVYDGIAALGENIDKQGDTGIFAAKSAGDYSTGGVTNWYLPTIKELEIIWNNMHWIETRQPGFQFSFDDSAKYWSCSEAGRSTGGIKIEHTFDSALSFNMVSEPPPINDLYDFLFYHITNRTLLLNVRPVHPLLTGYFA